MAKPWPVPGLSARDTFRTAAGRVLHTRLAEVLAYRGAVLTDGGVEDVHDLRVAMRRFRANFDAFRDCYLEDRGSGGLTPSPPEDRGSGDRGSSYEDQRVRLRDLARGLGEVRDADVLAGMLADRLAAPDCPEEVKPALRLLRDEALGSARRSRARRLEASAGQALGAAAADLRAFVTAQTLVHPDDLGLPVEDGLEAAPPAPAPSRARRRRVDPDRRVGPGLSKLLRRRLAQAQAADAAVTGPDDSQGLHNLRIALKRLRYLAEVGDLLVASEDTGALLDRLSELQDELGEVHDADVLAQLCAEHRTGSSTVPDEAWTGLEARLAADREAHRGKAESLLDDLRPGGWTAVRRPFAALR